MLVEWYLADRDLPARQGVPAVSKGTTLYFIEHWGMYFEYCFLSKADAEKTLLDLKNLQLRSSVDWSFKLNRSTCKHVGK